MVILRRHAFQATRQSDHTWITTCKYLQVHAIGVEIQDVYVVHCIKENTSGTIWTQTYTNNIEMPIYLPPIILINAALPCNDRVVALPHPKHFSFEVQQVLIHWEHILKIIICFLPKWTPSLQLLLSQRRTHSKVIDNWNIQHPVPLPISTNKFIFQNWTSISCIGLMSGNGPNDK